MNLDVMFVKESLIAICTVTCTVDVQKQTTTQTCRSIVYNPIISICDGDSLQNKYKCIPRDGYMPGQHL